MALQQPSISRRPEKPTRRSTHTAGDTKHLCLRAGGQSRSIIRGGGIAGHTVTMIANGMRVSNGTPMAAVAMGFQFGVCLQVSACFRRVGWSSRGVRVAVVMVWSCDAPFSHATLSHTARAAVDTLRKPANRKRMHRSSPSPVSISDLTEATCIDRRIIARLLSQVLQSSNAQIPPGIRYDSMCLLLSYSTDPYRAILRQPLEPPS